MLRPFSRLRLRRRGQILAPAEPARSRRAPPGHGRKRRARLITGLDIGTTKVCAIIAEAEPRGDITILGLGSSPSPGMRRGVVTDIDRTASAISQAFLRAHDLAHRIPRETFVGIAGDHIAGVEARGSVEVAHPNVGVDARDCREAIRRARQIPLATDMTILHQVVREYIVDGTAGIDNPVGLFGRRLEVGLHLITSAVAAGNNLARCVRKAGLRTSGIVLESLASSLAILAPRERELGVVMIDIGGGTTDIAIFAEGALQYTAEIALGGDSITQDVARILRCSPHDGENLKKKFGHALPLSIDPEERVDLPHPLKGGRRITYARRELAEIIEARVEDIFEKVKKAIRRSGHLDRVYAGVVLTGGTALLEGIAPVAERMLEFPTRIGLPQGLRGLGEIASSPIYSTAVGLIRWAVDEGPGYQPESRLVRILRKVLDIYG